jgi:hypothetical protein
MIPKYYGSDKAQSFTLSYIFSLSVLTMSCIPKALRERDDTKEGTTGEPQFPEHHAQISGSCQTVGPANQYSIGDPDAKYRPSRLWIPVDLFLTTITRICRFSAQ